MTPADLGIGQHKFRSRSTADQDFALIQGQMSSSERTIDNDEFRAHSRFDIV
jgi:hypothetical protein